MKHLVRRFRPAAIALCFAACATGFATSAASIGSGDERARIGEERSAAEKRFVARDKECRQRFVVSSCVEDARRERRGTLDALRARQLVIDEERRRERTTARRAELAAKAADDARREQERAARAKPGSATASAASAPRAGRSPQSRRDVAPQGLRAPAPPRGRPGASSSGPVKADAPESAAQRQAREARSRAAFTTRQQQAARHREEAIAAATRRMQQRTPSPSLPTPAASALRGASSP